MPLVDDVLNHLKERPYSAKELAQKLKANPQTIRNILYNLHKAKVIAHVGDWHNASDKSPNRARWRFVSDEEAMRRGRRRGVKKR